MKVGGIFHKYCLFDAIIIEFRFMTLLTSDTVMNEKLFRKYKATRVR